MKAKTADTPAPAWLKKRLIVTERVFGTREILASLRVRTVCESATCPNLNECYSKSTASLMILGDICTRNCAFCSVDKGLASEPEEDEPFKCAEAVRLLGLSYVVITSPARDDLEDGGAGQFVKTLEAIRMLCAGVKTEVLVPDFGGAKKRVDDILEARPDVFSHNIETVERMYHAARPQGSYRLSLGILRRVKALFPGQLTKTGIMAGLGETDDEVFAVIEEIRSTRCDILTIGQYLRPSKDRLPVARYVTREMFARYKDFALRIGFRRVSSGPFVRSSYNAKEDMEAVIDDRG